VEFPGRFKFSTLTQSNYRLWFHVPGDVHLTTRWTNWISMHLCDQASRAVIKPEGNNTRIKLHFENCCNVFRFCSDAVTKSHHQRNRRDIAFNGTNFGSHAARFMLTHADIAFYSHSTSQLFQLFADINKHRTKSTTSNPT